MTTLSPREQQVTALVAKGMQNRQIARELECTTNTVKVHLMAIFRKTGCANRIELACKEIHRQYREG